MKISHNKYKNTGILFELLVRKITSDLISNRDSKAVGVIKKYFTNTELAKEYKLYQSLISSKLNENKAESLISSALDLSKKINRKTLRSEKYNLIKEIKENYDIEDFFKTKINNYKEYASIYTLIESHNSPEFIEPSQIIENKCTLLEHISNKDVDKNQVKDDVLEEYVKFDKGTRLLTYKILVDKFNKKYSTLNHNQQLVLKEYINSISNSPKLKDFINAQLVVVKKEISLLTNRVVDQTTKIKLNEILTLIKPLEKKDEVKDADVLNLLQYFGLISELKQVQK